jgi:hypothetical protein
MAASVVILFARSRDHDFSTLREVVRPAYGKLVLVLVAVMPALSFVGMWDSYLSWALYSGNLSEAVIRFGDPKVAGLPESVRARVKGRTSGEHVLDVFTWSLHDVGLEPYPEPRVYRHVARWICQQVTDPTGIRLIIWTRPAILDGRREATNYTCGSCRASFATCCRPELQRQGPGERAGSRHLMCLCSGHFPFGLRRLGNTPFLPLPIFCHR